MHLASIITDPRKIKLSCFPRSLRLFARRSSSTHFGTPMHCQAVKQSERWALVAYFLLILAHDVTVSPTKCFLSYPSHRIKKTGLLRETFFFIQLLQYNTIYNIQYWFNMNLRLAMVVRYSSSPVSLLVYQ